MDPHDSKTPIHYTVVIDNFSKYVILGALKTKASKEIADWLETNLFCTYGIPFAIFSDRGTEFRGAIKTLFQDYSIETQKITPH